MADLRFTIERRQLRDLGILTAIVLAVVLTGGLANTHAGHIGLARIIVLSIGVVVCVYPFIAYLLAVTECTTAGIRTRGLGGPRWCSWPEVTDISVRRDPRSVLISVTTEHGRRFWLGAPVHGYAAMSDPMIYKNLSEIQAYWRWISAGQESRTTGTSNGADSLI